jgi:hypothetical protein
MPSGGTMKHENRGADFLVCWQAGKPAPHCLFSEQSPCPLGGTMKHENDGRCGFLAG